MPQITLVEISKRKAFLVNVGYSELSFCRGIPKAYYNKTQKAWIASCERLNAQYLKEAIGKFTFCQDSLDEIEKLTTDTEIPYLPSPKVDFKTSPKRHQVAAYNKLWNLDFAALFMGMGTGKTKTCIDLLAINKDKYKQVLVICPLSVRQNWLMQLEIHDTLNMESYILKNGTKQEKKELDFFLSSKNKKVMIIGAESLAYKAVPEIAIDYVKSSPTAIVFDESHMIKNNGKYLKKDNKISGSTRTANAIRLAKHSVLRYILTGTSISEGIENLFTQYTFLSPDILGTSNYYAFKSRYLVYDTYDTYRVVGYQNLDELHRLIDRYTYVCKKEAVVDLPAKNKTVRYLELCKEQKNALVELHKFKKITIPDNVERKNVNSALAMCAVLQQVNAGYVTHNDFQTPLFTANNCPKINEILSILEGRDSKNGVIIFAKYVFEINRIYSVLCAQYKCATLFGGTPLNRRAEMVADFQKGEIDILIINPTVGGTGIELTAADIVIYYSNSFSYVTREQSEDRAHRIGQNKIVTYIDLVYSGTIDEKILKALNDKKSLGQLLTSSDIPCDNEDINEV